MAGKLCFPVLPPVLILKQGPLCLSVDLPPDLGLVHHPVGEGARLSLLRLSLPLLGLGRRVLPGAAEGQDPAGHGRGGS